LGQLDAKLLAQKNNKYKNVWLATRKPDYFTQFGFKSISPWRLPRSVLLTKLKQLLKRPPNQWQQMVLNSRYGWAAIRRDES
jgi:N-acetylglutamate synthase-like GNAT family acetyltransferase